MILAWLTGTIIGCIFSVGLTDGLHLNGIDAFMVGIGCGFLFGTLGILLGGVRHK